MESYGKGLQNSGEMGRRGSNINMDAIKGRFYISKWESIRNLFVRTEDSKCLRSETYQH